MHILPLLITEEVRITPVVRALFREAIRKGYEEAPSTCGLPFRNASLRLCSEAEILAQANKRNLLRLEVEEKPNVDDGLHRFENALL